MDMFSPPRRAPKDEAEAKSVPVLVDITATSATADEEEGSPQVLERVEVRLVDEPLANQITSLQTSPIPKLTSSQLTSTGEPDAATTSTSPPRGSANASIQPLGPKRSPWDEAAFGYRADIDGLRCLAVLAVIVFHSDASWLPGGFVGVDIFFVISGYVVAGSLLKKPAPSLGGYLGGFYARRVKRLAPALALVVLTSGLMIAFLVPPETPSLSQYYMSGLIALFGGANIYFLIIAPSGAAVSEATTITVGSPPPPMSPPPSPAPSPFSA